MIITAFNPPTDDLERTFLTAYTAEGETTLTVKNNDRFTIDQRIMIGKMGDERTELLTTDTVTPPDTIETTAATEFAHNADDPVYQLKWDKVKFYRAATVDGTYSLLSGGTVDIDVDNAEGVTRFDDTAGSSTSYYKVKYANSVTLEETELSDPIAATGYEVNTAGKVIDAVVRRVRDTQYQVLSIDEYLDIMTEVNDDLITQSHRPYRFLKRRITLDLTAGQNYIDLDEDVTNFWKFDYLTYTRTAGGIDNTHKITPISLEAFIRKYDSSPWQDSDDIMDVAFDEANNRILFGPAPLTSQTGTVELHYYKTFTPITSLASVVETPNTLIYRYKMLAEYYSAKSETDRQWGNLAAKYEQKYGNEVVKMQRVNRADTGTPRSFAPRKVPGYRKRYHL